MKITGSFCVYIRYYIMELANQIQAFELATGIVLDIYNGRPFYDKDLCIYKANQEYSLPDNTVIMGDFIEKSGKLVGLGNGLRVYGKLDIRNNGVTEFPCNFYVGKDILVGNNRIKKFEGYCTIKGDFDISNNPIEDYPEKLHVYGSIDISNTNIKKYTGQTYIYGSLDIRNSEIKELSTVCVYDVLYISKSIELVNCDVSVGNSIRYSDSEIVEYKTDKKILAMIEGSLGTTDLTLRSHDGEDRDTVYLNKRFYKIIDKDLYMYSIQDGSSVKYVAFNIEKDFAIGNSKEEAIKNLSLEINKKKQDEYKDIITDKVFSYSQIVRFFRSVIGSVSQDNDFDKIVELPKQKEYKLQDVLNSLWDTKPWYIIYSFLDSK